MRVKFWGTRGSIAAPGKDTTLYGGNTTCLEVILDSGKRVVLDAGTGIRLLGQHLSAAKEKVAIHLLITHIHWDHVLGFPFFAPLFDTATEIQVDGYHTCMKGIRYPFDTHMGDGFFPVKFNDLKAKFTYLERMKHGPLVIDGVTVDPIPLQHPQGGFGFRFRERKRTLVFITDNELREDAREGRRPQDYAKFCKDADVLIHDAQYTPEEIDPRRGWGHSDYTATCKLALEAHVKRLILFHHDPSRKDDEVTAIQKHCEELIRQSDPDMIIEAAREESELNL
jgi:phosphoribosyl 1,2-cyclic phosphodiesterase